MRGCSATRRPNGSGVGDRETWFPARTQHERGEKRAARPGSDGGVPFAGTVARSGRVVAVRAGELYVSDRESGAAPPGQDGGAHRQYAPVGSAEQHGDCQAAAGVADDCSAPLRCTRGLRGAGGREGQGQPFAVMVRLLRCSAWKKDDVSRRRGRTGHPGYHSSDVCGRQTPGAPSHGVDAMTRSGRRVARQASTHEPIC